MLLLKYNTLEFDDLIRIERQYLRWLKSDQSLVASDFNVLDYSHIDLYGHLLGMFGSLNIPSTLNVTASQLLDFFVDLDRLYLDTPYHSFYHAVDIVTVLYFTMTELDAGIYFEEKELAILFLAAICHDAGHPGYNNDYQIRTQSKLGLCYKESVLESYSIELSLSLINKHSLFGDECVELFRRLILSTDMTHHFELLEKARDGVSLAEILLHAADISNTVRAWPICKQWSDLIVQEFFRQGDAERLHGLSVSPGMDRYLTSQANISLRFGDLIVRPYFEALQRWFPKTSIWITHLEQNKAQWEKECEPPAVDRHRSVNWPAGALRFPSFRRLARASSYSNIFTSPSQSELRRNSVQPILS